MQLEEFSEASRVIVDANAENMIKEAYSKEQVKATVEVIAVTLHITEDKARTLLSKRIKEIQNDQVRNVLELLKPQTKRGKKKKEVEEEPKEENNTNGVKVTSFAERQKQEQQAQNNE